MMDSKIGFKEIMIAYSIENASSPKNLSVYIPDIFPDMDFKSPKNITYRKNSMPICLNKIVPVLSERYSLQNFLIISS